MCVIVHEWVGESGYRGHDSSAGRYLGFHTGCRSRQECDIHKQLCADSDGHICVAEERDQHSVAGGISGMLGQCMCSECSRSDRSVGVGQCDVHPELVLGGSI